MVDDSHHAGCVDIHHKATAHAQGCQKEWFTHKAQLPSQVPAAAAGDQADGLDGHFRRFSS